MRHRFLFIHVETPVEYMILGNWIISPLCCGVYMCRAVLMSRVSKGTETWSPLLYFGFHNYIYEWVFWFYLGQLLWYIIILRSWQIKNPKLFVCLCGMVYRSHVMNRISDKGKVYHPLGTCLITTGNANQALSHSGYTGIKWPDTLYSKSSLKGCSRGHGNMSFPSQQLTCRHLSNAL